MRTQHHETLTLLFTLGVILAVIVMVHMWLLRYMRHKPHQHRLISHHQPAPVSFEMRMSLPAPVRQTAEVRRAQERTRAAQRPPEVTQLDSLVRAYEQDSERWDVLLAAGDLYRRGAYPRFLPNPAMAARLYRVASMCPCARTAGLGQAKYIETHEEPIDAADRAGRPLPTVQGQLLCDWGHNAIMRLPSSAFDRPTAPQKKAPPAIRDEGPFFTLLRPTWHPVFGNPDLPRPPAPRPPPNVHAATQPATQPAPIWEDRQNVHDHGVTRSIKATLDKLQPSGDPSASLQAVTAAVLDHPELDAATKEAALHTLSTLHGDAQHSVFGMTEQAALDRVWHTISTQRNTTLRSNLTETLAKQLASGVEHGHVVCSSGKITRIVGTLDGSSGAEDGDDVTVRPMWAVREELASKAASIRDRVSSLGLGDDKAETDAMTREFAEYAREEYVSRLGMSESIVGPLILEFSSGF